MNLTVCCSCDLLGLYIYQAVVSVWFAVCLVCRLWVLCVCVCVFVPRVVPNLTTAKPLTYDSILPRGGALANFFYFALGADLESVQTCYVFFDIEVTGNFPVSDYLRIR